MPIRSCRTRKRDVISIRHVSSDATTLRRCSTWPAAAASALLLLLLQYVADAALGKLLIEN